MKIKDPEKRLQKFWGKIDKKHISIISDWVYGENILDLGTGFGTTSAYISKNKNFSCVGVDCDENALNVAQKSFPATKYIYADAKNLPFNDKTFDTIILRDVLHHFYSNSDFKKIINEIQRVAKDRSRLIFFDPNINLLLRTLRMISFHKDEECNLKTALEIMKRLNYKIITINFNTMLTLPLSGGYVGINFVPNIDFLHNILIRTENFAENIVKIFNIEKYFCIRYMIVGEK